jgi:hypothetical protein
MPQRPVVRFGSVSNFIQNEVDMSPENSQEYQRAVEEAANAFMKVMALRGFNVRDYPLRPIAKGPTKTPTNWFLKCCALRPPLQPLPLRCPLPKSNPCHFQPCAVAWLDGRCGKTAISALVAQQEPVLMSLFQ